MLQTALVMAQNEERAVTAMEWVGNKERHLSMVLVRMRREGEGRGKLVRPPPEQVIRLRDLIGRTQPLNTGALLVIGW